MNKTIMKKYLVLLFFIPCLSQAGEFINGLNLSSPLLFSGTVGYRFSNEEKPGMGPMMEAEAGIGGAKLLLGFDGMDEGFGFGVKASYLTTWFEPVNVDADQQYLGMEFQAGNTGFIASFGAYAQLDGDDDSFITTLSIGIRFK
ncbi:hypothetical protein P0Y35_09340 [Kiritimatiellaeota bacterium B1221]|nr:hypothetical protein [Kiritimatiellaeota bacterium B1221]